MKKLSAGLAAALFLTLGAAPGTAAAASTYQVKCPLGYTLKSDSKFPFRFYFHCERSTTTNTTKSPTCPAGQSYESRNPPNKDRCKKITKSSKKPTCRLLATDKTSNWTYTVINSSSKSDECRSKKGKQPKGIKCSFGYKLDIGSEMDRCTKVSYSYSTPKCSSGSYLSRSGKDVCYTTSKSTSVVKPFF